MKPFQKTLGVSAHVIKFCSKATGKVTHFLISKVIGAGGSVTIQSLLLASNAWLLYAGIPFFHNYSPAFKGVSSVFCTTASLM